jgi:hypothetical protein
MNGLINDIFGDKSITLDCESGECLHYTQVPGYQVSSFIRETCSSVWANPRSLQRPEPPNNNLWVGLSAGLAAIVFLLASFRECL